MCMCVCVFLSYFSFWSSNPGRFFLSVESTCAASLAAAGALEEEGALIRIGGEGRREEKGEERSNEDGKETRGRGQSVARASEGDSNSVSNNGECGEKISGITVG